MAPRLKVFRAQMGFHEAVVAAPSQTAALAAWGTRQDLFGEGLASVVDDPAIERAALAEPGVVLRRPAGGKGSFRKAGEDAGERPKLPKAPPKPKAAAPKTKAKAQPKPLDRSRLDEAEAALAEAKSRHETALAGLARERQALDARELDLHRGQDAETRALERKRDAARAAFDKASGPAKT
jgi:hypothetical protein